MATNFEEPNETDDNNSYLMDKNKKLFPQKLWELIHNPYIQHCLRWSQDGQRVYLNRQEFEQYYLKTPNNQFHTQKAISFVRQMNMYGFRKVDDCYYENDNFRRDSKHLLKNMIRRHPNKGLFVGLVDHHQLSAAAAAAAAAARLQVNHQFQQQFVYDQHQNSSKQQIVNDQQRASAAAAAVAAEQTLRLNNYLNSGNRQELRQQHNQHQNHLQSHLAAAVAAHQQQNFKHSTDQQVGKNLTISNQQNRASRQKSMTTSQLEQNFATTNHQHKMSRWLGNFYADNRGLGGDTWNQQQDQDLRRKNSSFDIFPSNLNTSGGEMSGELSPRSLVARQALLNETLVRSLLQLKQQQQHSDGADLLANLAQQQQSQHRILLESLASLSSAGTGSIIDPASNSPTERTATPPSRSPSPSLGAGSCASLNNNSSSDNNNDEIGLNLAKSPVNSASDNSGVNQIFEKNGSCDQVDGPGSHDLGLKRSQEQEKQENESDEDDSSVEGLVAAATGSPLDGQKKVRKFLEDQMNSMPMSSTTTNQQIMIDCEKQIDGSFDSDDHEAGESAIKLPQKKRFKRYIVDDEPTEEGPIDLCVSCRNCLKRK